ncbi:MAG: hypothetical protein AABY22_35010 [Nanoarchaeota archaeon]
MPLIIETEDLIRILPQQGWDGFNGIKIENHGEKTLYVAIFEEVKESSDTDKN